MLIDSTNLIQVLDHNDGLVPVATLSGPVGDLTLQGPSGVISIPSVLSATGGGLITGTWAGAPTFSGVLSLGGVSVTGAVSLGTGSTNYVTVNGSAGPPSIIPGGAGSNISLVLQGKGTGIINASSQIVANAGILVPQATVLSGSTGTTWAVLGTNLSGTYSGGAGPAMVTLSNATDTTALTGASSGGYPSLRVNRQFGGVGCSGGRLATDFQLWCNAAITGDASTQQYQAGNFAAKATVNVGGTDDTTPGNGKGFLYGSAFYGSLQSGATNWALVNAQGETDIEVYANTQSLTVGGTVTASDTLTVTFTGSGIAGSPVSVTYTVQSGNTLYNITQNIISAIQNTSALAAAGVTATLSSFNLTGPATLSWNTDSTVTVSVSTSGGATETLTLGSVVPGASTHRKLGASIVRLLTDNQCGGEAIDAALLIASQGGASALAGWDIGIGFGIGGAEWPLKKTGTLILATQRTSNGGTRQTYAVPPLLTRGLDLSGVNFADQSGFSLFVPGFSVSGAGVVSIGNAALSYSSTGLTVDATGFVGTGNATVVSGGASVAGSIVGNYFVGDIIFDSFGGQHRVTSISTTTGKVTGLTTLVQPYTSGTVPAGTQATTGGSGLSLTIGITWTAATTMKLNPSGGAIQPGSGAWTANGAVATALSSVGPTGSHTTVQEWFTVKNASGTVRYIPAF